MDLTPQAPLPMDIGQTNQSNPFHIHYNISSQKQQSERDKYSSSNQIKPVNTKTTTPETYTCLDVLSPLQRKEKHQINNECLNEESKKVMITVRVEFDNDDETN